MFLESEKSFHKDRLLFNPGLVLDVFFGKHHTGFFFCVCRNKKEGINPFPNTHFFHFEPYRK